MVLSILLWASGHQSASNIIFCVMDPVNIGVVHIPLSSLLLAPTFQIFYILPLLDYTAKLNVSHCFPDGIRPSEKPTIISTLSLKRQEASAESGQIIQSAFLAQRKTHITHYYSKSNDWTRSTEAVPYRYTILYKRAIKCPTVHSLSKTHDTAWLCAWGRCPDEAATLILPPIDSNKWQAFCRTCTDQATNHLSWSNYNGEFIPRASRWAPTGWHNTTTRPDLVPTIKFPQTITPGCVSLYFHLGPLASLLRLACFSVWPAEATFWSPGNKKTSQCVFAQIRHIPLLNARFDNSLLLPWGFAWKLQRQL